MFQEVLFQNLKRGVGGNSRTHLIYEEVMKKYEVKEGETEHGEF